MGWAPGKGLGAKEDGRVEHIKVAYKHDSQGMLQTKYLKILLLFKWQYDASEVNT